MADNSIESVVAEAVKAKVQIMVAEALGDPGDLMAQFVAHALQQKVQGRNYRDVPLITKLAEDTVGTAAKAALQRWLEDHTAQMQAEIERQLTAQKKDIAAGLVASLLGAAQNSYRLQLVFKEAGE
jgi:hypothetical protein